METREIEKFLTYIGDGVYLVDRGYDGYHYWLITTDGYEVQNKIALDLHTAHTLVKMLENKLRDS